MTDSTSVAVRSVVISQACSGHGEAGILIAVFLILATLFVW